MMAGGMRKWASALVLAVMLDLGASGVYAQTSAVGGALDGVVEDAGGGRIPDAPVKLHDLGTRREREARTDAQGVFRMPELRPGIYELSMEVPGFAPYRHTGLIVALGSTVHLEIRLESQSVRTQVTVSGQVSALDPAQVSVSSAVDTERIEELPVESRNYLNFVLLAPAVTASAQQPGRQALAPLPDSGFTFGGLRGRSNNLTIDGVDNNDEYTGASRTELSLETIQEFQVVNAGLSAETGGASGGSINVITRNGANAIHGDAFLFIQNGALDARNPLESERVPPDVHRYRTGVALGGPLVRDKTFYYAAFEQEHNRSLEDSYINPGVASAVDSILARGAFPRLSTRSVSDSLFPTARAETEASLKINHQLTGANSLMVRYAFTNNREAGDAFNTSGLSDASARGSSFIQDQAMVGALTTIFDPSSVGDLRLQFAQRRAVVRTNDVSGPGIDIAGLIDFGRPYEGNGRRTETHDQAGYTYSHQAGAHLWKAGVTYHRVTEDAAMADGFGGFYRFATPADFAAGRPLEFRQAFGSPATNFAVASYGGFVNDHWSATSKLVFDFGVRYDFEHLPNLLPEDMDNFSPRIGLAYHVAPRWVIRAGHGIFYDRYVLAALDRAIQKNGASAFEQVLEGPAATLAFQLASGGSWSIPLAGVAPSVYTVDHRMATPYSQQSNLTVEHLLSRDLTAGASLLLVRGVDLSRTRNLNRLPPGPPFSGGRANSAFNDIFQLEDSASSTYRGATFSLNRRISEELEFSASYTLARTTDNGSDFTEQPQNPFYLAAERALSLQDQRHRFVANALWELPIGDEDENGKGPASPGLLTKVFRHIEVAPIVSVESGRPVNPLVGVDNGSDAFPLSARPAGFGRNSLPMPLLANADFRVLKYFSVSKTAHLDVVAEAFNLFNHTNVIQINPVFGLASVAQPGFQEPVTGAGARQIQFSLDFEF
jgi:hypothetical protein